MSERLSAPSERRPHAARALALSIAAVLAGGAGCDYGSSPQVPGRGTGGAGGTGLAPADPGGGEESAGGGAKGSDDAYGYVDTGPRPPPRLFLTRSVFTGNLGGLEKADELCQVAARGAGLPGTWMAWLSDSRSDAIDRGYGSGPWYLLDGKTKVFNNRDNLLTGPIVPFATTEFGESVRNAYPVNSFWTGTARGGRRAADTCRDWTSADDLDHGQTGNGGQLSDEWTATTTTMCAVRLRLLCLEKR